MKLRDIVALLSLRLEQSVHRIVFWHCWLAAKLKSEICATLNCIGDIYFHFRYISFYYNNLFLKIFSGFEKMRICSKRGSGGDIPVALLDIHVPPAAIC